MNSENSNLLGLFFLEKKLILRVVIVCWALGVLFYFATKGYVGTARILINDSQNNLGAAAAQSISGVGQSLIEGKKGNSQILNQVEQLKAISFFEKLNAELSPIELKRNSQFFLESDFILKYTFLAPTAEEAYKWSALISEKALIELKTQENSSLNDLIKELQEQKKSLLEEQQNLKNQLKNMNVSPDLLWTNQSEEKIGVFLTDLNIRAQEKRLEIAQKESLLKKLAAGKGALKGMSTAYGIGGKIQGLKNEISDLKAELIGIESSSSDWKNRNKGLTEDSNEVENIKVQLKANGDALVDINQALIKVQLQKRGLNNHYQLLEPSRLDSVKPRFSFWSILAGATLLAQILSSLMIYFKHFVLKSRPSKSEESRSIPQNGFYIEDARFYIDNGQLKFRTELLDGKESVGRINQT